MEPPIVEWQLWFHNCMFPKLYEPTLTQAMYKDNQKPWSVMTHFGTWLKYLVLTLCTNQLMATHM